MPNGQFSSYLDDWGLILKLIMSPFTTYYLHFDSLFGLAVNAPNILLLFVPLLYVLHWTLGQGRAHREDGHRGPLARDQGPGGYFKAGDRQISLFFGLDA